MLSRFFKLFRRDPAASSSGTGTDQSTLAASATALRQEDSLFIARATEVCSQVAAGNLESRLTGYGDHPGYGPLAHAINNLLDRTDSYVRETAAAMQNCSQDKFHRPILLRGMKGAFRQSSVIINQAALKMQASHGQLAQIARLAEQNTSSVTTVAAACEELHATTGEISQRVRNASGITASAVSECDRVSAAVKTMVLATEKAESMITLIDQIAAQTKLLALNASITAAHGGVQGQRFGVVANEVKVLAHSTASATENIRHQVEAIQQTMATMQNTTNAMATAIGQIDESSRFIARSVQDQVTATDEIARTISGVSENTRAVAEQIGRVA